MQRQLTYVASLLAAISTIPAQAQTGHPYWPMNNNQPILYSVFEITGTWNEAQMRLSISSRKAHANSPQTITTTNATCPKFFGQGPLFKETYTPGGGNLHEGGGVTSGGLSYIGEAINADQNVTIPFLAKITFNPVAGQTISGPSMIYKSCNDTRLQYTQPFHWKYRTIEHLNNWGKFNDVWLTGLREYGFNLSTTSDDMVYNYVFQRGKGMVNFWYGTLDPTGTKVTGYEYYAIR